MERLRYALHCGADAVYLSGRQYGLRAFADNFAPGEMKSAVSYVHSLGKKVYVTLNCFARQSDLIPIADWLCELYDYGADAAIVSDPGVVRVARKAVPGLALHLSTQANTMNAQSVLFWMDYGIKRVILARELTKDELIRIRDAAPDIELEVFVHGAMCVSYSGRCVLSNYFSKGKRESNAGECTQPCRWSYSIHEEKHAGEFFPVRQDELGTYVFNSHDLMLLGQVGELIGIGVDSLKIEGRMKSILYVATITNAYRRAIDAHELEGGITPTELQALLAECDKVSHRPYTTAYYGGDLGADLQSHKSAAYLQGAELAAVVLGYDERNKTALLSQRNRFFAGETLELLSPGAPPREILVKEIINAEGESVLSAPHPEEQVRIPCEIKVQPMDLLRKVLS